jgi:hypothetical protein
MQDRSLGKVYSIKTSVPMLQTFDADIPIEQMTLDAIDIVKEEGKKALPWVIAGGAVVVTLSVIVAAALFVRKRW